MPTHLKTGIIVIHQLPKTPETLWLRMLGKGGVQAQAIQEVAARLSRLYGDKRCLFE